MDPKHITSHSLRSLLSLTEKKEQLLKDIEEVENEIAKALKGAATTAVEAAETVTPFKPSRARGKKTGKAKTSQPGGLKERILALLHDAGNQGLKVKEVAEKLGAKSTNISVWFSTTGKKLTTKIEPGRYAAKGKASVAKPVTSAAKPVVGYLKPPAALMPASKRVKKVAKTRKASKHPF